METLNKTEIEAKYAEVYAPLVENFCAKVCATAEPYKPTKGNLAPAPFLPIIGNGYYEASTRVAVFGMETYCWHDLYRFIHIFADNSGSLMALKAYTDGIEGDENTYKKRFHNHHGIKYENSYSFGF